ncbi:hypothetical protein [Bradyrhizobium zhanjiangense]|uniref:hypothetical protein n=1 Tax=Bradyrhizobium zhanjiangense TaxID=1325107 RepID=UPI001009E416|nr:hypothetical protein [Bradyrhizobium zhanjiangense]
MRWLKLFDADLVTQVHGARRIGGVSLCALQQMATTFQLKNRWLWGTIAHCTVCFDRLLD